jgi:hypothetical protein
MAKRAAAKRTNSTQHVVVRSLANISAAELRSELLRRRRRVQPLARRYERLMERAAKVRAEIDALGGSVDALPAVGDARRRPRNRASLVQTLKTALTGNTLSVEQAMKKVLATGYRSSSPSFRAIVNRALIKNAQFKRVGRGRYTVK